MLTEQALKTELPNSNPAVRAAIIAGLKILAEKYGINTTRRLAHFLAQTAHESGGFRVIQENLNYSADGLNRVFPKYFRNAGRDANQYKGQPEKIANIVYASRMGNGDIASGDGYRFRGRGLIQLTGRANYTAFAKDKNLTVEQVVAYLSTPEGAVESAAWFWGRNGLNALADKDDVIAITKRINGGTNGLAERQKFTNDFKRILGA